MTLLRLLTFLHVALNVTLIVLLFRIYFYLLTIVFVLQWLFFLGNSDYVFVSVSFEFLLNSDGNSSFHCSGFDYSFAFFMGDALLNKKDVKYINVVFVFVGVVAAQCMWMHVKCVSYATTSFNWIHKVLLKQLGTI